MNFTFPLTGASALTKKHAIVNPCFLFHSLGPCIICGTRDHNSSLGGSIVREMRFFAMSTDSTQTLTMSPTLSTSLGCLM